MKQNRLNRVLEYMAQEKLPQILVTSTEAVYYLTGLWITPGERMLVLKVSPEGCALYGNRLFALEGLTGDLPLIEYDDTDDPVALLADGLKDGPVGIDKNWHSHFAIRLMQKKRSLELRLGSGPVDTARMYKDEEEMNAMRASSRLNDRVVDWLPETLKTGDTELGVGRRYLERGAELGAQGGSFDPLVCFGANCAEPHHGTDNTELRPGSAVILDLGFTLNHAASDMTRTVYFGEPDDDFKRVYDIVKAANAAGRAAVRPGVPVADVDRAARKVIEDAGYGPNFLHRTGHGIGIEVHEPPDISRSSSAVCRPGMTFSVEPGVYLPGRFGVRVEDLVAVTEDGCETLNQLSRELKIIRP